MSIETVRKAAGHHYRHPQETEESLRYVSPDVVYHSDSADPTLERWRENHEKLIGNMRIESPEVIEIVVEGDMAVTYWTSEIVVIGPVFGLTPNNQRFTLRGFGMDRVRDGLVVEHWGMQDMLGALRQLDMQILPPKEA